MFAKNNSLFSFFSANGFVQNRREFLPVDSRMAGTAACDVESRLPAGRAPCTIAADARIGRLERG